MLPLGVASRPFPASTLARLRPILTAIPSAELRRQYQWPVGITLVYAAALLLADSWHPGVWRPLLAFKSLWLLDTLVRCVVVAVIGIALLHVVRARNIREGLRHAAAGPLAWPRLAHVAIVVFLLVPLFYHLLRSWKAAIGQLHPFRYDVALANLDAWLHGGDPWRPLHALTNAPRFIQHLDSFYTMGYFFTLAAVIVWVAWRPPDTLRARFFLALVLVWVVLGTAVALAVSSGGPIFYERITGSDRFAEVLATLQAAKPLRVLLVSDALWASYLQNSDSLLGGITAFPSLHLAMPTLYTCYSYAAGYRHLAGLFALLTIVTLFGSVYLAWHYAIDGYAAILGTVLLWWIAGRLTPSDSFYTG